MFRPSWHKEISQKTYFYGLQNNLRSKKIAGCMFWTFIFVYVMILYTHNMQKKFIYAYRKNMNFSQNKVIQKWTNYSVVINLFFITHFLVIIDIIKVSKNHFCSNLFHKSGLQEWVLDPTIPLKKIAYPVISPNETANIKPRYPANIHPFIC